MYEYFASIHKIPTKTVKKWIKKETAEEEPDNREKSGVNYEVGAESDNGEKPDVSSETCANSIE